MSKIRSHYDNLMVANNASPRVIKAAYKALCQTYHPDKYQGGVGEAERIMKIINAAYEVLSDPLKKAEHDAWLAANQAGRVDNAGYRRAEEGEEKPDHVSQHAISYRMPGRGWLALCCGAAILGFFIGSKSFINAGDSVAVSASSNALTSAMGNTALPDADSDVLGDDEKALAPSLSNRLSVESDGRLDGKASPISSYASPPTIRRSPVTVKHFDPLAALPADVSKLQQWAEQGNALAQYALGTMYFRSEHYRQALFWYRKAAGRGSAAAQDRLGAMYGTGKGVPQDDRQAFYWYRKSAQQGNADAQYHLGLLYASQQGGKRDDNQALYWWRKAAQQGHAEAAQLLTRRRDRFADDSGSNAYTSRSPQCVIKPVMSDAELEGCTK
ncbi:MAG: J domain-containing protein [Gammaproteobacteria bacterium]